MSQRPFGPLTFAFVGGLRGCSSPGPVPVIRQAVLAVGAVSAVLAETDHAGSAVVDAVALDAVRGVAVALTPNQMQCFEILPKTMFSGLAP